jgi:hypothetical protein
MNITGETLIFRNEFGYSTSISRKNQDGEYEKMYLSVQLPKGVELENKTKINIKNGFLSYYNTKDGLPKIKIVVMEYTTDADEQYKQEEREAIQNEGSYEEVFGGELPF